MQDIVSILRRRKNIAAAYVFGSLATGRNRRESDFDLAILAKKSLSGRERIRLETEFSSLLPGFGSRRLRAGWPVAPTPDSQVRATDLRKRSCGTDSSGSAGQGRISRRKRTIQGNAGIRPWWTRNCSRARYLNSANIPYL